jgi:N-acetylglucosaminyldiphosphoundecaprenol N-acetyl-beta-D-mannosaminyltransferase
MPTPTSNLFPFAKAPGDKNLNSVSVLGVSINNITFNDAVSELETLSRGKHNYFVTPNPEMLVEAHKNPPFKKILNSANLSIPDGIGLKLFSKIRYRVAGTDVFNAICSRSVEGGSSIFLLGGFGNTSERLRNVLQKDFPGINILGSLEGDPDKASDKLVVSEIKKITEGKKIDFLFVAYGHPKQENWIARNTNKLNTGVAGGVGGAFDFYLGVQKRAPFVMRSLGLEWLFRLLRQPRARFKRIFDAVVVFPLLVLISNTNTKLGGY